VRRKVHWWAPSSRWRVVGFVDEADEVPKVIARRGVVLAGGTSQLPKWIAFDCPCLSDRVMVTAVEGRWPRWRYSSRFWTGVTLVPSIDTHHAGKKCHYLIRGGRVLWARDSQMGPDDE
jgi:Family of unknown function (DUF6527)